MNASTAIAHSLLRPACMRSRWQKTSPPRSDRTRRFKRSLVWRAGSPLSRSTYRLGTGPFPPGACPPSVRTRTGTAADGGASPLKGLKGTGWFSFESCASNTTPPPPDLLQKPARPLSFPLSFPCRVSEWHQEVGGATRGRRWRWGIRDRSLRQSCGVRRRYARRV